MKIVLSCLVYNSPGCSVANDALRAIDDGVELYSMRVFEDNSSSVVSSNWDDLLSKLNADVMTEIALLRTRQRA